MVFLKIDDLQDWYTSGDVISGSVEIRGQTYASAAEIVLEGRSKSRIVVHRSTGTGSSTQIYRGRTLLLHEGQVVPPSLQNVGGGNTGSQSFPFSIVIPNQVQDTRAAMNHQNSTGGLFKSKYWTAWDDVQAGHYAASAGHLLPPTFALESRNMSGRYSAFVSYAIKAVVTLNGTETTREVPIRVLMRPTPQQILQQRQSQPHSLQQTVTFANPRLSAEYADRDLKFKEKMSFMFHSSRVPSHTFRANISCPNHVVLGDPVKVEIRLSHDVPNLPSTQVPDRPTISVGKIQLSLACNTHIRCPSTFGEKARHDSESKAWSSGVMGLRESFSKQNDYTLTWISQPLPYQASPSFTTYNIRRTYFAKIKVEFICAGKTEELKREYMIHVHPWQFDDAAGNSGSQQAAEAGSSRNAAPAATVSRRAGMGFAALRNPEADDDDELPPPTYNDALKEPPVAASSASTAATGQPGTVPSREPEAATAEVPAASRTEVAAPVGAEVAAAVPADYLVGTHSELHGASAPQELQTESQASGSHANDAGVDLAGNVQKMQLADDPKVY